MSLYFPKDFEEKEMPDFISGVRVPVDKPVDWTSFDVVAKLRNQLRKTLGIKKIKVGHSGTLDPFATGLLIICTGKATKELGELTGKDKVYTGTIQLGAKTLTYDNTSEPYDHRSIAHISRDEILAAASKLTGEIEQQVPAFSAVKQEGKRLYEKARKGEDFIPPTRKVMVYSFEISDFHQGEVKFRVHCGKGTYIRSLAHDMGEILGCGGYLSSLRRESIGEVSVGDAWSVEGLINYLATHSVN